MLWTVLIVFSLGGSLNALNQTERDAILDGHNTMRSEVQPTAADMLQLEYEVKLEELAQEWVNRCRVGIPDSSINPEYANLGANTALNAKLDLESMMQSWRSEGEQYNYSTGTCKSSCFNYLQVVWATTAKLGCAYYLCTDRKQYFFVCLYKPPGDPIRSRPYQSGTPCSKCPSGYGECKNNTCIKSAETAATTSTYEGCENNSCNTSTEVAQTITETSTLATIEQASSSKLSIISYQVTTVFAVLLLVLLDQK